MEQMKRISAKFESEWMKKPLSSNIHPVFAMLQQKDPLEKLEHFLSTNDISRQITDKLETPLHVLFRKVLENQKWKYHFEAIIVRSTWKSNEVNLCYAIRSLIDKSSWLVFKPLIWNFPVAG